MKASLSREVLRPIVLPVLRLFRRPLRAILLQGAVLIMPHPALREPLRAMVARFPFLERRLKAHMLSLPEAALVFAAAEAAPSKIQPMSEHAVWIHAYIQQGSEAKSDNPQAAPPVSRVA